MPDIGGIIQGVTGAVQAIGGAIQQKRYSKKYEKLINSYVPDKGIMGFYNEALQRYGVDPQSSALYKRSMRDINRNQAGAISALQDRRSALSGISSVLRASNDASLNAEAVAEQQKDRRFGELGGATGMKAQEDKYKFENLAGLYGAKATGGANIMNAGLSNLYGAGSSLSQMAMYKQMYGGNSGSGGNKTAGSQWPKTSGGGGFYGTRMGSLYR